MKKWNWAVTLWTSSYFFCTRNTLFLSINVKFVFSHISFKQKPRTASDFFSSSIFILTFVITAVRNTKSLFNKKVFQHINLTFLVSSTELHVFSKQFQIIKVMLSNVKVIEVTLYNKATSKHVVQFLSWLYILSLRCQYFINIKIFARLAHIMFHVHWKTRIRRVWWRGHAIPFCTLSYWEPL